MPYLVAGAETVYGTFNKFREDTECVQHKIIKEFLEKTDSGYLFSFGNGLSNSGRGKKVKIKGYYAKSFSKFFKKDTFLKNNEVFNIEKIVMDSGGYQAQSGYLSIPECYEFTDEYVEFVKSNKDNFSYFFALDLIPNGLTSAELLKMNDESFSKLAELDEDIRKKVIFIYHFFTPKVYEIWKTITKKYFDKFSNYYAFGGLAAKDTTSVSLPISVFAIGIVQLVYNAKIRGMNKLSIHILGAASYRDIMLYQLYKVIIKEYHNVDLDITYDSSLVFKQIHKSRCINILEEDYTNNLISLKEANLGKMIYRVIDGVGSHISAEDLIREKYTMMLNSINPEYAYVGKTLNIYEDKADGTGRGLGKTFGLLSILFAGWQYNQLEYRSYAYIQEQLRLHKDDTFTFYDLMSDILLKLNAGKLSYKFKGKLKYVRKTVECLINLDPNEIDRIVNTHLAGSEIVDLVDTDDMDLSDIGL